MKSSSHRGARGPLEQRNFLNDDYRKYAGPDYREQHDEGGSRYDEFDREREELRRRRDEQHPGVSGKSRTESWFNQQEYATQKSFIGKGPKGYRRDDARILEDTCEALQAAPAVDARAIEVSVKEGVVYLEGVVDSRFSKKEAERIIENLPGVQDVQNRLCIDDSYNEIISRGPGSVTQNDVGFN
jgi:hypothetical protein